MKVSDFIKSLSPPAQKIFTTYNLFASVNLAQIANETGWLAYLPHDIHTGRNSFNIYGIKGTGPAGSVYDYTQEDYNGNWVKVLAQFAAYASYLQSMQERVDFLKQNSRYAPVFKAKNAYAQAYALQDCGWATDPKYGQKLVEIINEFNLTKFDQKIKTNKVTLERYNVVVGWFDSKDQAKAAADQIKKTFGYHSMPQKV